MDMIERVAAAMWERSHDEPWDESHHSPVARQIYLDDARTAIEEMREPTEAMELAGVKNIVDRYSAEHAWRAMIDAALKEPSSSTDSPQPKAALDQPAQTQPSGNYRR